MKNCKPATFKLVYNNCTTNARNRAALHYKFLTNKVTEQGLCEREVNCGSKTTRALGCTTPRKY